tara:strand:- start:210 stop:722 length:513 start_codon:yes stop_codon:yes gene_type:complete
LLRFERCEKGIAVLPLKLRDATILPPFFSRLRPSHCRRNEAPFFSRLRPSHCRRNEVASVVPFKAFKARGARREPGSVIGVRIPMRRVLRLPACDALQRLLELRCGTFAACSFSERRLQTHSLSRVTRKLRAPTLISTLRSLQRLPHCGCLVGLLHHCRQPPHVGVALRR